MWCRTILTAIAISCTFTCEIIVRAHDQGSPSLVQRRKDILCMLLLSGLQKEDLDNNTLAKLDRHHVNIDDMNNESRRQECLVNSYLASGNNTENFFTTEDHNMTFEISTTYKSIENNTNVQEYPKNERRGPEILVNKSQTEVLQNEAESNESSLMKPQEPLKDIDFDSDGMVDSLHNLKNETNVKGNNELEIENIQNQPDIESVMNFWTKLSQYTEKVVIKAPTTSVYPHISDETNVTTVVVESSLNNGYVHSQEMEYISRILAEYLASQAATSTTQKVSTIKANTNSMPRNTEVLKEPPIPEHHTSLPNKNIEQHLNYEEVSNFTQVNMQREVFYYYTTIKPKSTTNKVSYDDQQDKQHIGNSSFNTMPVVLNPLIKYNLQILENFPLIKNDFNFTDEEQFKQYSFLQLMKDLYNIDDPKNIEHNENVIYKNKHENASIQLKEWQPIPYRKGENRQFKAITIDKSESGLSQDVEINNDKLWKYSEHPQNFGRDDTHTKKNEIRTKRNESEEIQNISMNNNSLLYIPVDMKISNQNFIEKLQKSQNSESNNNSLINNRMHFKPEVRRESEEKQKSVRFQMSNIDSDLSSAESAVTKKVEVISNDSYSDGLPAVRKQSDIKYKSSQNRMSKRESRNQFKDETATTIIFERIAKASNDTYLNAIPAVRNKIERKQKLERIQISKLGTDHFDDDAVTIRNIKQIEKAFNDNHVNMPAVTKKTERKHKFYRHQVSKMDTEQFNTEPTSVRNVEQNEKELNNNHLSAMPSVRQKWQHKHESYKHQMIKIDSGRFKHEMATIRKFERIKKTSNNNYLNAMPAQRQKFERIQESHRIQNTKIDSEQFDNDAVTIGNIEQVKNIFNDNGLIAKHAVRKKKEQIPESELKPMSKVDSDQFNTETAPITNVENISKVYDKSFKRTPALTAVTVKESEANQNHNMILNERQDLPANVINEIAEKVKQIVLRNIEKDLTTTSIVKSTPSTTTKKSTPLITTRKRTTTIQDTSSTRTTVIPSIITSTSIKSEPTTTDKLSTLQKEITEANDVIQKLMEIFDKFKAIKGVRNSNVDVSQNYGTTNTTYQYPKQIYPFNLIQPPHDMQSIQLSPYGPSMVPVLLSSGINLLHHQQQQTAQYVPQVNYQQRKGHAITIQTNSNEVAPLAIQISNPVKVINQNILVTTKSPADKLKAEHERENQIRLDEMLNDLSEHENQKEILHLQPAATKKVRFSDIVKRYHEYGDRYHYKNVFNKHREEPVFNDYNGNFHHSENSYQPQSNMQDGQSQQTRPTFHDKTIRQDRMRHRLPSFANIRQHQRYETSKFHEKLERIDNSKKPQNSWREMHMDCCDEIPARQQVSLSRVKQRARYDDTHFRNFLKSQQKVTDMLEKILANKMKPVAHSVETT